MSEQERHDKAVAQAIEIAGRHPLPLTTRSLTAAENRKLQRKELGCLFDGGAMLLALAPFMLLLSGDPAFAWPRRALVPRPRRRSSGRSAGCSSGGPAGAMSIPRIEIEAGEDGVDDPARRRPAERLDYGALVVAVRPGAFEREPFLSIVLELPDGPIELDNGHYRFGRTTGAAILARVQAAGGRVRPAEDQ